ncbi:MAG: deoxyribose-phosphate aldolase [Tissierellia bacterium]|nr:deoxyribose-phosphate aldolase [Tissierellia bacterium]
MENLNKYIDHTLLKPEATKEQIQKIVDEAKKYEFKSVCVNSSYVSYVANELKGSEIGITSVIGFPLGAMTSKAKAFEAKDAIDNGATEIDMVINIGRLKDKDYDYVLEDIKAVRKASEGKVLKVIIETCLLTDEEKVKACELSKLAKADFVKTSTGFSTAGAKASDVKLMRETVGDSMGVKASGGIHSKKEALEMIENGANRLGTSQSIDIVEG